MAAFTCAPTATSLQDQTQQVFHMLVKSLNCTVYWIKETWWRGRGWTWEWVGVPASHREWRVERGWDPNCKIKPMAPAATSKLGSSGRPF